MRAFAGPAGIGVVDEPRLPESFQWRDQHVMDNSIAEIRREDFSELVRLDDETDRTRGMAGPALQLLA